MNSITQESLELMKEALAQPDFRLAKSMSTATGLLAFDLQAPAKNLYPFVTPLRNIVPRVGGGVGSATNWRQVNAIIGSGFDCMGWVPEGQRSGQMDCNNGFQRQRTCPRSRIRCGRGRSEATPYHKGVRTPET